MNEMNKSSREADLQTPASLFSDPADLRLADCAHNPVTAVLLDDDHLTRRTVHRVTELQQLLQTHTTDTVLVQSSGRTSSVLPSPCLTVEMQSLMVIKLHSDQSTIAPEGRQIALI